MQHQHKTSTILILCGLMLIALACTCGPLNTVTQIQATVGAAQEAIDPMLTEVQQNKPTFDAMATELSLTADVALGTAGAVLPELEATMTAIAGQAVPGTAFPQWAASAEASSEYGASDWSAIQAAGAPNTPGCGDFATAWASATSSEAAILKLLYAVAVVPSSIEIHQSYNPNSVVKVEVIDEIGASYIIYEGQPATIEQCPYVMVVSVTGVTARVNTVIISIDQSVIGDWNEIDAVELIGTP
ncbi:MAG: hypothetical protein JXB30_02935 [Anaerolineae bacterium]|nr:hypothetical protein [Anaerolineae bacterium]